MKKDKTIIQLIKKLDKTTEDNSIEIVDYWDADLCAIGLKKENRLIYISTYNYLNDKDIKYDIELELTNPQKLDEINIVKKDRGISEDKLLFEITSFLK